MSNEKKVGVAFDFDGTLADSLGIGYEGVLAVFREANREPPSRAVFLRDCHPPFEAFLANNGIPFTFERVQQIYYTAITPDMFRDVSLFDGAKETLAHLQEYGIPLALVTANREECVRACFEGNELDIDVFDQKQFLVRDKKTALEWAKRQLAVDELWYVGDSIGDTIAAKAVGVVPVAIDAESNHVDAHFNAGARCVLESVDGFRVFWVVNMEA